MTTPNLNDIRMDPELLGALEARARRARSEAVGNLVVALIEHLRARLTHKPAPGPLLARLG